MKDTHTDIGLAIIPTVLSLIAFSQNPKFLVKMYLFSLFALFLTFTFGYIIYMVMNISEILDFFDLDSMWGDRTKSHLLNNFTCLAIFIGLCFSYQSFFSSNIAHPILLVLCLFVLSYGEGLNKKESNSTFLQILSKLEYFFEHIVNIKTSIGSLEIELKKKSHRKYAFATIGIFLIVVLIAFSALFPAIMSMSFSNFDLEFSVLWLCLYSSSALLIFLLKDIDYVLSSLESLFFSIPLLFFILSGPSEVSFYQYGLGYVISISMYFILVFSIILLGKKISEVITRLKKYVLRSRQNSDIGFK